VSVALVIQYAIRMRYSVICALSGCAVFSTLSHKWHDVRQRLMKLNGCSEIL